MPVLDLDRAHCAVIAERAFHTTPEVAITALRAAQRLEASSVMVNDHTAFRTDWMPFAGRKQSGYGVGGIPFTMRELGHEKMVVLKHDAM